MKTTGLTLAEADASGRPMRYKYEPWIMPDQKQCLRLTLDAAISSDWEIQPLPLKQTWTREEVEVLKEKIIRTAPWYENRVVNELFTEAGV